MDATGHSALSRLANRSAKRAASVTQRACAQVGAAGRPPNRRRSKPASLVARSGKQLNGQNGNVLPHLFPVAAPYSTMEEKNVA